MKTYQVVGLPGDGFKKRYRIVRKLGSGRHATAWLAKDDSLEKYVALKVAVASDAAVRSEADALCSNPNKPATPQLPVPKLLDSLLSKV
ncbi:MAG: kinase domain-containing [Lasallia pustulata]|uniref:Kinase domain-containing n=1 Tax=Lasallia pustulata TaxID=136370 RepID=A0A5M8Q3A1_9LECA|nr:MAG: kinase domain-containing [Lasallia pustulata]